MLLALFVVVLIALWLIGALLWHGMKWLGSHLDGKPISFWTGNLQSPTEARNSRLIGLAFLILIILLSLGFGLHFLAVAAYVFYLLIIGGLLIGGTLWIVGFFSAVAHNLTTCKCYDCEMKRARRYQ